MNKKIVTEIKSFFHFDQDKIDWGGNIIRALCVALPLLIALLMGNITNGLIASLGAMVVMYYDSQKSITQRMVKLILATFGLTLSYALGLICGFNQVLFAIVFGMLAVGVYYMVSFFKIQSPYSFFFIMMAAIAGGQPFEETTIAQRIGLFSIGAMASCTLVFIFSILRWERKRLTGTAFFFSVLSQKEKRKAFSKAIILGVFMTLCMYTGYRMQITNPYWIPISCLAVMQANDHHIIWRRVVQRIIGTFSGVAFFAVLVLSIHHPMIVCVWIFVLQLLVEFFIRKNYALAVIFITPLTILLAETGIPHFNFSRHFIHARLVDITIGSLIGAIGGWVIHNKGVEKILIHCLDGGNPFRDRVKLNQG